MKLSIETLLGAVFEAKKIGKGRIGRGKVYTEFMQTITDSKDISYCFGGSIDRFLFRLLRGETTYAYSLFSFERFEKSIGSYQTFEHYLIKMRNFCNLALDENKIEQLAYTLLEILRQDGSISCILYGSDLIAKKDLFGSYAHPKKICIEALMTGLLYHVHKNPAESISIGSLEIPDKLSFSVTRYADEGSLNTELEISLYENIRRNAERQRAEKPKYKPELKYNNIAIDKLPENDNVFLYGTGGAGKTTLLMDLINGENTINFYFPLYRYRREFHENFQASSCWILLNILLKYHYQYEYETYETLTANEGENIILQQLTELNKLLNDTPVNGHSEYTLLLDGMNEMGSDTQYALVQELETLCRTRKNVRIIITGRTAPKYDVFDGFQHIEVCGITDSERNAALSAFGGISDNKKLMDILKIPMFLNMYIESRTAEKPLNTRGEILDLYITDRKVKSSAGFVHGSDEITARFIIQYILPYTAKAMFDKYNFAEYLSYGRTCFEIDRCDLLKAIENAYSTYITDEFVYQSCIVPKGFRKRSLLESREKFDFIELITENIGLMKVSESDPQKLHFTHQYFRDYFAAKHILNLLDIMDISYKNNSITEQKELLTKLGLDRIWFYYNNSEEYGLIGEICGDYKNIPDGNDPMWWYNRTILDEMLDMYRGFAEKEDGFRISENIINVMSASRNGTVCSVDLSNIPLPYNIPCNVKFSQDGKYPCSFRNSTIYRLGICENAKRSTDPEWIWEKFAVISNEGNKILAIMDNNYIFLWDIQKDNISWDSDLSEYVSNNEIFNYAEFSTDESKILLYAGLFPDICKVTIDPHSGQIIDRGREKFHKYCFSNRMILSDPLKLKMFSQLPHFRNCDFSGAKFMVNGYGEILNKMRIISG